jgi:fructose-bisphosphate aldolase, class I
LYYRLNPRLVRIQQSTKEFPLMAPALEDIANAMVADGKGLLAADESTSSIAKRFEAIKVTNTEENRRDYREFMFRTTEAMKNYISGVILFDETIRQKAKDGTPLVKIIQQAGSIPGIKVDQGPKPIPGFPGETVTEGLDKLNDRMKDYYELGARFAKWRAVVEVGRNGDLRVPSRYAIEANNACLARYAAICQANNIVPIVEPEVLMDGDHDIDRCQEVTEAVLVNLFSQLHEARVKLEGTILKPNMVISGKLAKNRAGVDEVAERTVRTFLRTVPAAIPGIMFLSGGQSDEEATAHLSSMNAASKLPWKLSFSYGRALQAAAQKAWGGKSENVAAAQRAFLHRARMNMLAAKGEWKRELEKAA